MAALLHLVALAAPLSLPVALVARRAARPFVAHHGRQSLAIGLVLAAVLLLHGTLHAMVAGTAALGTHLEEEYGSETPAWTATALGILTPLNLAVMLLEIGGVAFLALRMASRAWRGQWAIYFFLRKNQGKNQAKTS